MLALIFLATYTAIGVAVGHATHSVLYGVAAGMGTWGLLFTIGHAKHGF